MALMSKPEITSENSPHRQFQEMDESHNLGTDEALSAPALLPAQRPPGRIEELTIPENFLANLYD